MNSSLKKKKKNSDLTKYYGSQWGPSTVFVTDILQNTLFLFSRRKKWIQVWNNLRVS